MMLVTYIILEEIQDGCILKTWYMGDLTEPDVTNNLFPLESSAISCLHIFSLSGVQNLFDEIKSYNCFTVTSEHTER